MKKKEIIIVGAGTFACNVISYLEEENRWKIIGLLDNNPRNLGKQILGYKIIGDDDCLPDLFRKGIRYAVLGIGATADFNMQIRKRVFLMLKKIGFKMVNIISKSSIVHRSVIMGEGIIVPPYVVLDPEVKIGDNVFLSPYVYISHHVELKNHIFISSFVNFVGGIIVKDGTFIGMSSTICKNIGKNCNIYPNTLVMEPLEDNMIGFGNPMKKVSKSLFKK